MLVCTGLHVTPAVPDIKGVPENLVPQQDAALADPATSSGIPQTPPVPDWPKSKQSPGVRVIHSSQYKRRQEFKDRRVLILGVRLEIPEQRDNLDLVLTHVGIDRRDFDGSVVRGYSRRCKRSRRLPQGWFPFVPESSQRLSGLWSQV